MPAAKLALAVNTHFYAESYTRGETALAVKLPAVKGSAAKDPRTYNSVTVQYCH
jgi:hypothetical protein